MYESPINIYMQEMHNQIMEERENAVTATILDSIGVDINKDELFKALQFDRQQYHKGYHDAKVKYESMLETIKFEIDEARFVDKDTRLCRNALASGLEVAMQIIDKYITEVRNE